jgi:hypothetical protein
VLTCLRGHLIEGSHRNLELCRPHGCQQSTCDCCIDLSTTDRLAGLAREKAPGFDVVVAAQRDGVDLLRGIAGTELFDFASLLTRVSVVGVFWRRSSPHVFELPASCRQSMNVARCGGAGS